MLNGDFGVNIKVPYVEGLTLKVTMSLDKTFRFRKIWQKPWYLYSWDGTSMDEKWPAPIGGSERKGLVILV